MTSRTVYPVIVCGERVQLREFERDDVDAVMAIYGDPRVTQHLSFEPLARPQVQRLLTSAATGTYHDPRREYLLAVDLLAGGPPIGVAHLTVEAHWAAVIAVAIHHDHWHRGLGMETAQLLLMLGFGQLRLHRIWAARSPCDSSSERLLRNTGMMEEGRIRHHVYAGDVWRDSITHVILEDEWLAHQIRRPSPTRYSARTRP